MLERLRLKRSTGKAGGGGGSRSRDTRTADSQRQSSSHSTSKDAEPLDKAAEPSARGAGPSTSGEGADSAHAKTRRANGGSVSSVAAAQSVPGAEAGLQQPQPATVETWRALDEFAGMSNMPPSGLWAVGAGAGAGGVPGMFQEQLEGSMQALLAQDCALLPARPPRPEQAPPPLAFDIQADTTAGTDLPNCLRLPLYADAPYGHGVAAGGGGGGGGAVDAVSHVRFGGPGAPPPLRTLGQLGSFGGGAGAAGFGVPGMRESPRAAEAAGMCAGAAVASTGLQLADNMDLEQQIRAMYKEMDIGDVPSQQPSVMRTLSLQPQQQGQQHPMQQHQPLTAAGHSALPPAPRARSGQHYTLLSPALDSQPGTNQQQHQQQLLQQPQALSVRARLLARHPSLQPPSQHPAPSPLSTAWPHQPQHTNLSLSQPLIKGGSLGRDVRIQTGVPGYPAPYMGLPVQVPPQAAVQPQDAMDVEMQHLGQPGAADTTAAVVEEAFQHWAHTGMWQEPANMAGVGGGSYQAAHVSPQQLQHQHQQSPQLGGFGVEPYAGLVSGGGGMANFGAGAGVHDGSRAVGGRAAIHDPRNLIGSLGAPEPHGIQDAAAPQYGVYGGGYGSYGGGRAGGGGMAAIPEAGDGVGGGAGEWCSPEDVDAALDHLMEEAGSGAVYYSGQDAPVLERVSFKLHNVHPRDLPRGLLPAVSSWLAGAPGEVVQGSIRPGCTHLIIDVFLPQAQQSHVSFGGAGGHASGGGGGGGASELPAAFRYLQQAEDGGNAGSGGGAAAAADASCAAWSSVPDGKATGAGSGGRVLGSLLAAAADSGVMASLEAAAAAAGGEALGSGPVAGDAAYGEGSGAEGDGGGGAQRLARYVAHGGNARAAMANFKRILGPRAVQSMTVTVGHETLLLSGETGGRHVADFRGTLAGMRTPLLLSVAPLAVLAGAPCKLLVRGCHIHQPGCRPHLRCRGAHMPCSLAAAPGGGTAQRRLRPSASAELAALLEEATLPGSHRNEAAADCTMAEVLTTAPEPGLLFLEWEAERAAGAQALSEWLPLLAVPDHQMATEINRLPAADERARSRLRSFLCDLGLVLDFVTRVQQHVLLPAQLPPSELELQEGQGGEGAAREDARASRHDQRGAAEGTADDRVGSGGGSASTAAAASGGGDVADSLDEMLRRPRLSKKHLGRVATLAPQLLAFAADSGLPAVMSWVLDFTLEHITFGDLAAAFQAVEGVGGPTGLPLLHRAVRSGNPRCVSRLIAFARSCGMSCNFAQAAGPFRITPLHLAALQPSNSLLLQACLSAGTHIAQLWHAVVDAAGRTPAAYSQRQVARTMHDSTGSGDSQRPGRASSGSTNAYRSWGSEEPPLESNNGLNTHAGTVRPEGAVEAQDAPPAPEVGCSGSAGGASTTSRGSSTHVSSGCAADSAEDFYERDGMRRAGIRLADAVAVMKYEDGADAAVESQAGAAAAGHAAAAPEVGWQDAGVDGALELCRSARTEQGHRMEGFEQAGDGVVEEAGVGGHWLPERGASFASVTSGELESVLGDEVGAEEVVGALEEAVQEPVIEQGDDQPSVSAVARPRLGTCGPAAALAILSVAVAVGWKVVADGGEGASALASWVPARWLLLFVLVIAAAAAAAVAHGRRRTGPAARE